MFDKLPLQRLLSDNNFREEIMSAFKAAGLLVLFNLVSPAFAQVSDDVVKIGVLNDQSGLYADIGGSGSVLAAKMAVEDFGGSVLGKRVEVISADHQNKPDVGSAIARRWFDTEKVDAIVDVPHSATALAVLSVTREKNKVLLLSGPAYVEFTGKECAPTTVHWTYDSYAMANGTARAVVKQGGDSWFFITGDNAGSHSQQSGAKVIGLANAGGDTVNSIKQANEFGLTQSGQKLAGLLMFITDVKAVGLEQAKGLIITDSFYWNADERTQTWSRRFMKQHDGRAPTSAQAGVYSAVTHYLKAIMAAGTDEGLAVSAIMKKLPVSDFFSDNYTIRPDGRLVRDMYLLQVKTPGESKEPWDLFNILARIPGDEAYRPMAEGQCPLVK
jgi:branched-chain amino acid transport system substrate-binding protein